MEEHKKAEVVLTNRNYLAEAKTRNHFLTMDQSVASGGDDSGATPVEFLLTAIGGCVSMTLRTYAERRGWDLGEITVNVTQLKDEKGSYLTEKISFEKEITEEQRKKLLVFAGKCPVAKMIKGETRIFSSIL
ncbi:OsmC family protein [Polaribacter sp. R2A056_3_33]|jgi:putative redox protein|uniref:OsmC family protein n=1 Tax=unclassified Polaribacter TaxID=196858 RepID=UPI001C4EB4C8|nr:MULTISPECIES: OsmC family protein [unclassified Polaribacter]QXP62652.1 OsmC family protein [Polaribacter sp. HaHaR_3_91]QXP70576.1 OsmC family protein [Polaribacter sp. R2A056_3_33]